MYLFSIFVSASPQDCQSSFENIASFLEQNKGQTSQILSLPLFAYSGKQVNDVSQYELCRIPPPMLH